MDAGTITEYVELALTVVGGVSLLVAGAAKITGVTPGTRDDQIVGRVQKVVHRVQKVLGAISLDTSKKQAQK